MILRLLFLILFLLIGILFTLGYNLFSIINFKNKLYNVEIFIDNMNINNTQTNETINYKYNDLTIDNSYKIILTYLYYICIATSCLIGGGIIVSYLRMKFISKILFILAQIFMSTCVGVILFIYYSSSFIENIIPSPDIIQGVQIPQEYKKISASYGTGGLLLIISYVAMIVIYILYLFIG